ncbi:MAG: hypothetical protein ACJ74W_01060 [Pyrinomonadaceae bacterium]
MKLRALYTPANVMLCVFVSSVQFASGWYSMLALELPAPFVLLRALGYVYVLGYWLTHDSRQRQFKGICDLGLWLFIAWPVLLPYYLFKTRGWRALLTLLLFSAIFCVPYLLGGIAGFLSVADRFD